MYRILLVVALVLVLTPAEAKKKRSDTAATPQGQIDTSKAQPAKPACVPWGQLDPRVRAARGIPVC